MSKTAKQTDPAAELREFSPKIAGREGEVETTNDRLGQALLQTLFGRPSYWTPAGGVLTCAPAVAIPRLERCPLPG
jgi:hypothetical protein